MDTLASLTGNRDRPNGSVLIAMFTSVSLHTFFAAWHDEAKARQKGGNEHGFLKTWSELRVSISNFLGTP